MRIILVNYRYFISGGPERYYFNIKEVLERHGHEVIPFSIKSSRNIPNSYEDYFLDIVDDEIYFSQAKRKTPKMILKSFSRMFYSLEARSKMSRLIEDTKPDVVYVMQMHNKISPSIVDAAKSHGIPVVHRISDFQYMCPNALFYNDVKGICEDCIDGHRWHCVKYKCVLGSYLYSGIKAAAKLLHDVTGVTKKIDAFVVPSSFTLRNLNRFGLPLEKLHHIPTFFNLKEECPAVTYEPYFLYIGRIEKQKGLMTLVKSFADTGYKLKVIGFSNGGYIDELKAYLSGKPHNIEFLGRLAFEHIVPYLRSCLCTVVPSEWYDNFPNAILESFAYKKAVLATAVGSLPELVENGATGLTFKYASVADLSEKARTIMENTALAAQMGEKGYERLRENYSPEKHYEQLIALLDDVINKQKLYNGEK